MVHATSNLLTVTFEGRYKRKKPRILTMLLAYLTPLHFTACVQNTFKDSASDTNYTTNITDDTVEHRIDDLPVYDSNTFYVAPDGDDQNPGTKEYPFKTLERARQVVSSIREKINEDIVVYLRGGNHYLTQPLELGVDDSGTNGKMVRYEAYPGETPIIHGGTPVTGWEQHDGNIYKATLYRDEKLRQLYVNGQRATMAKGETMKVDNRVQGYGSYTVSGDESWAINSGSKYAGYTFSSRHLKIYGNSGDVEMISKTGFGYHVIGLADIITYHSLRVAVFQQPIGAIAQSVPNYGCQLIGKDLSLNAVSDITFQNAYELLDKPGEFYFDRTAQTLYYYPRENEDMTTAEVIAPISEGLIRIRGNSTDERASNISFKGIIFGYDHWPLMKVGDSYGDTAVQSIALYSKYVDDGVFHNVNYGNTSVQGATFETENASNIHIIDSVFRHLGAVGVSFGNDTVNSSIIGCVFNDVGSAAINVGDARNILVGDGDYPNRKEGVPQNITIQNNYIETVSVESKQAPAVSLFLTENLNFSHNEIYDVPYSGISLGWGWVNFVGVSHVAKNNKINNNIIARYMQSMHDGAAIYTLGEQPGSEICGNYINGTGNGIYLDQGSAYFKVDRNVCKSTSAWLFIWGTEAQVKNISASDNYSDTLHGTEGNHLNSSPNFTNAGNAYSAAVHENEKKAGLESTYLALRSK